MKTKSLFTFALGIASLTPVCVLAQSLGNLNLPLPFQVAIPDIPSGLDITLQGLYLQPVSSDAPARSYMMYNYGSKNTLFGPFFIEERIPGPSFAYMLGLGYFFPETGEDIRLDWTHFNATTDGSASLAPTDNITFLNLGPPAGRYATLHAANSEFADLTDSQTDHYDAIDLDVGQYLDMGTRLRTRLFAGLRLARIKHDDNITVIGNGQTADTFSGPFNWTYSTTAHYTGLGPFGGGSAVYELGYGFGVFGLFDLGLLAGNNSNSFDFIRINYAPDGTAFFDSQGSLVFPNQTIVVPFLDVKLGANYTIPFSGGAHLLRFDLGYQTSEYIHLIDTLMYSEQNGTTPNVTPTPGLVDYDASYNGLYFGVDFKI